MHQGAALVLSLLLQIATAAAWVFSKLHELFCIGAGAQDQGQGWG